MPFSITPLFRYLLISSISRLSLISSLSIFISISWFRVSKYFDKSRHTANLYPSSAYRLPFLVYFGLMIVRSFPYSYGIMTSADFLQFVVTMRASGKLFYSAPPARPPRVSIFTFASYICRIYTAKFGQYRTLFCLANSSALHCLICDFCSSDRGFDRKSTFKLSHPTSFRLLLTKDALVFV